MVQVFGVDKHVKSADEFSSLVLGRKNGDAVPSATDIVPHLGRFIPNVPLKMEVLASACTHNGTQEDTRFCSI